MRDLIAAVERRRSANFHHAVAEPLPTTVFLQLLGLPVSRAKEFIALKDGIIRPPATDPCRAEPHGRPHRRPRSTPFSRRRSAERAAGAAGRLHLQFLDAEVDGHRLTHDEILDICYLFFLAGLDTVTASLDCFVAYLAQHPTSTGA